MAKPRPWLLPAALAGVALLGLPTVFLPFGRDQGFFASVARAANDGGVIYRDAWDIKPPMIYWIYAIAQAVFGQTTRAAHWADLASVLATCALLYALMKRLFAPGVGVLAALLYGAWYFLALDYWNLAQAEGFLGLAFAAAALSLVIAAETDRADWAAVGGAWLGVAFLLKTTALLYAAASPLVLLVMANGRSFVRTIRLVAFSAAGFLAPCALAAAYFAMAGAWRPFLDVYAVVLPGYWTLPGSGNRAFLPAHLRFFGLNAWVPVLGAAALLLARWSGNVRRTLVVLGLAALSMAGVWLQRKYFLYHWVAAFGPLACLAALGAGNFVEFASGRGRPAAWAARVAIAVLLAATSVATVQRYLGQTELVWAERAGRIDRTTFEKRFGLPDEGDFYLPYVTGLADAVRQGTPRGATIYLWGFDPLLYFLADRDPASRFVGAPHVYSDWAPARWRNELTEALLRRRPAVFVVDEVHDYYWVTGNHQTGREALDGFPEVRTMLDRDYRAIAPFGPYRVYGRRVP